MGMRPSFGSKLRQISYFWIKPILSNHIFSVAFSSVNGFWYIHLTKTFVFPRPSELAPWFLSQLDVWSKLNRPKSNTIFCTIYVAKPASWDKTNFWDFWHKIYAISIFSAVLSSISQILIWERQKNVSFYQATLIFG